MKELKGIALSANEPLSDNLWIHNVGNKYVIKVHGSNGWEDITSSQTSISWNDLVDKPEVGSISEATSVEIGGVRKISNVEPLSDGDTLEVVIERFNALLTTLKARGIMVSY